MEDHNLLERGLSSCTASSVSCILGRVISNGKTHLDGQSVLIPQRTAENDNSLHARYLPLDDGVKVFLTGRREWQEVYGTKILSEIKASGVFWQEGKKRLVDILGEERREGSLIAQTSEVSATNNTANPKQPYSRESCRE